MKKYITKSIFVDYTSFPKLAWWHRNDNSKYQFIKKIESEEEQEKIIRQWQDVEDQVAKYFEIQYHKPKVSLFSDSFDDSENINSWTENYENVVITQSKKNYFEIVSQACQKTLEAIQKKEKILYQPSFLFDNCFVRADFLVMNEMWTYDLFEVKSKTTVKKTVKNYWEDEAIWEILPELKNDLSFQKYVINQTLKQNNLAELWDLYLAYLNKEYVRNWPIDVFQLIKFEKVDIIKEITVFQWKKDNPKAQTKTINDVLLTKLEVEQIISQISQEIVLSEVDFNLIHNFPGNKYLEYFGQEKPFGTIFSSWIHQSSKDVVSDLYLQWKTKLEDLSSDEIELFNSKNWLWTSRVFINNYLQAKYKQNPILYYDKLVEFFSNFQTPLCFYDYETISTPIPYLNWTYPYQQVVVQYSLHKYYENWKVEHYGWIFIGEWAKNIQSISIQDNQNIVEFESEKVITGSIKDFVSEFVQDIWENRGSSSFLVWNKWFENSRNREIAKLFPEFEDIFHTINENTFDLMEIVTKNMYFDIGFKWSASIKKVLPVLVPEMSYQNMEVANWSIAMDNLFKIISGSISENREHLIQELLRYCWQDSYAMLKIRENVVSRL